MTDRRIFVPTKRTLVSGRLAHNNPMENRYQRRGRWSPKRGVGARPENIRSRKNTKCFADYSSPVESYASNTSERIGRVAGTRSLVCIEPLSTTRPENKRRLGKNFNLR